MRKFLVFTFLSLTHFSWAQDDLLSLLDDQDVNQEVYGTFKATRVINGQSIEMPAKSVLQFVVEHRFGTINSGAYELWGLDQASTRISLEYGISESIAVGVARNSFQKTFEVSVKNRIIRQKWSGGSKLSIGSYHAAFINSLRWINPERENFFESRG